MSPYEQMRAKYLAEPEDLPFESYLMAHHRHPRGVVIQTPDFFVMGLPVTRALLESQMHPLLIDTQHPDCWYVSAMAGDMGKAWGILPYPLPWIAFDRGAKHKKELRILPMAKIRDHLPR